MERAVDGMLAETATTPATSRRRRRHVVLDQPERVWAPRLLLVAYVVLLLILRLARDAEPAVRAIGLGDVPNTSYVFGWLRDLAVAALSQTTVFLPVGFLALLSYRSRRGFLARLSRLFLPALLTSLALTVLVRGLEPGQPWRWPGPVALVAPLAGCLLGMWLAITWRRGLEACLWFLPSSPSPRPAWDSSGHSALPRRRAVTAAHPGAAGA
jgi:hypothetical protein